MTQLFKRVVKVTLGTNSFQGLRTQLKIKKTLKKEPNEGEVVVFNLAEEHRQALQQKGQRMIIEAGYENLTGVIFSGDIRYATHLHEGADWITKVQSGDGERAYKFDLISENFTAGTLVADAIAAVITKLHLENSDAIKKIQKSVTDRFAKGHVANGRIFTELDKMLKGRGLDLSVQDGRLQLLGENETTSEEAIVLGSGTGLVGSPEFGTARGTSSLGDTEGVKGAKHTILKVKSLLNPLIHAGARIRVQSREVHGDFKVITVEHKGDTHAGEWYSECEATPVE